MRKSAFISIALLAIFLMVFANSEVLRRLEHLAYDLAITLSLEKPASDQIVIVAIDDKSIESLGPWPWSRDILAQAQRRINAGRPNATAYTLSFEGAHNVRGLQIMGEFRDDNAAQMSGKLKRRFQSALNRLDSDHSLAMSFRASGKVYLGLPVQYGENTLPESSLLALAGHSVYSATGIANRFNAWPSPLRPPTSQSVNRIFFPNDKIAAEAAGLAAWHNSRSSIDGPRSVPLILNLQSQYWPNLPLVVAMRLKNKQLEHIKFSDRAGLTLDNLKVPIDGNGKIYPYFYKSSDETQPFTTVSILDVVQQTVPSRVFTNKAVVVGITANRFVEKIATPLGQDMSPVELLAHATSSIIQGDVYRLSTSSYLLRYLGFALIAVYLMLLLPRMGTGTGLAMSALLAVLLINVEVILMLTQALWAPMMLAVTLLISGHIVIAASRSAYDKIHEYKEALSVTNLQLGQTLQSQGQLDQAFSKYRGCVINKEVLAAIYSLGEDFERKRQFKKAADVFKYINSHKRKYKDVESRMLKNEKLDSVVVLGKDPQSTHGSTLIQTVDGINKPVLGRYEIEKELGRGSMGMVYLGQDPQIGRTVAIKTMSFAEDFDEENVEEMKQRFKREAKTAGRLKHPNIVTIYDVGEESDLSYIAMDYLEGTDLSGFMTEKKLLAMETVLDITLQVADALNYAHENGVFHRDIKPHNIIYNNSTGVATVTDFGVACLADGSTTKTGIVLGSPSYMSPEQLAGKRIDGRSDLYSLGVTLYQLVCGKLPFKADTLSNLMYKITHDKHPDIKKQRDNLPYGLPALINKCLHKEADKRYQTGKQLMAALKRCREKLEA